MIVAHPFGGLANQMVIYAAVKSVAQRNGTTVFIDKSYFNNPQQFSYQLDKLNIPENLITSEKLHSEFGVSSSISNRVIRKIKSLFKISKNEYREKDLVFSNEIYECGDSLYVKGSFISYLYYKDIINELKVEFKPGVVSDGAKALIKDVQECNSVSIHYRRGDYASNKKTTSFHGLLGLEYYKQAYFDVVNNMAEPVFYIFSDDPEWAKEQLSFIPNSIVIDRSYSTTNIEELEIMKYCKSNIIANSGFSRWAGLLNYNDLARVYIPETWFKGYDLHTSQLAPSSWVRIPSYFES